MNGEDVRLAALVVRFDSQAAPGLRVNGETVPAELMTQYGDGRVFRYTFTVPAAADSGYTLAGSFYPVNAALHGDLRFAYVSCNGQEEGDRERDPDERNRLWARLAADHDRKPLQLLLQGGDQVYADEMLDVHPLVRAWAKGTAPRGINDEELDVVRGALREFLFQRYMEIYTQSDTAWLMARVPSLCMWDDHDICDGWGSLPASRLDAPIGRVVFDVARELFVLFQLGATVNAPPPICVDRTGASLTWAVRLPRVGLVAPDLRSERRPERVMTETGWQAFRAAVDAVSDRHVFVLSSVPALGPRLSWVEALMQLIPHAQKYEDDLRDQWQSRAHRDEWRAFLQVLLDLHDRRGCGVTVLSGEIHLATRGTMSAGNGQIHQLVASGITHPPPPAAWARTLSALARLGEAPLPRHPIRLHPLPGKSRVYTAQRNYLVLERLETRWHAWWELEHDGATPALSLDRTAPFPSGRELG